MTLDQFRQIDIEWDTGNAYNNYPHIIAVASGDNNGRVLNLHVTNNGAVEDLSSLNAVFVWKNLTTGDNGAAAFEPYDPTSNTFSLPLPNAMVGIASSGQVTASIILNSTGTDSYSITSRSLQFTIEASAMTGIAFSDETQANLFATILQEWKALPSDYAATSSSLVATADSVNASVAAEVSSASDIIGSLITSDSLFDSTMSSVVTSSMNNIADSMSTEMASAAATVTSLKSSNTAFNGSLANSLTSSMSAAASSATAGVSSNIASQVSSANVTVTKYLGDGTVSLDSLAIDDTANTGTLGYTETDTMAAGGVETKTVKTTASFWTNFKTWLTTFIGSSNAATADDLSVVNNVTFPKNLLNLVYPVGTIYTSMNSANPATFIGGTWVSLAGRVLVGVDPSQTEFATVGQTGGEKTHTLSVAEMPSHTHTQDAHSHPQAVAAASGGTISGRADYNTDASNLNRYPQGVSTDLTVATNQSTGGGAAHNNLQPYMTAYMWRRTA